MASPTNVIVELFNNRSISSIDQILGLLRPNTPVCLADEIGFNPALDYPALAARWMLHLKLTFLAPVYLGDLTIHLFLTRKKIKTRCSARNLSFAA